MDATDLDEGEGKGGGVVSQAMQQRVPGGLEPAGKSQGLRHPQQRHVILSAPAGNVVTLPHLVLGPIKH